MIPNRKFDNLCFPVFLKNLEQLTSNNEPINSVDDEFQNIIMLINQAIEMSQNRITSKQKHHKNHWWDEECQQLWNEAKEMVKIHRRTYDKNTFLAVQKKLATNKKIFRQKKSEAWTNFCKTVSGDKSLHLFWKMARNFKNRQQEKRISLPDEIIEQVQNKFCPPLVTDRPTNFEIFPDFHNEISQLFSKNEFDFALANTNNTAPGKDQITFKIMKVFPINLKLRILNLYNLVLTTETTPAPWSEVIVIPILKPNKSKMDPDSYRPISLLGCFRKLFEKMLQFRLEWFIESNSILNEKMYGFRRHRGTQNCINKIIRDIKNGFFNKQITLSVFIDLSQAYDKVNVNTLCGIMSKMNILRKLIKIIWFLMKNRDLWLKTNQNLNFIGTIAYGLPQGSVLSPLLFNIYMADAFCIYSELIMYADDIIMYATGRTIETLQIKLQSVLNKLNDWCALRNLVISEEKTVVQLFSKKHVDHDINIM